MDPATLARFEAWLHQIGIEDERRVARLSPAVILVSKFEAGFAARLIGNLDRIADLFDDRVVAERYRRISPDTPRIEAWRLAIAGVLREGGPERGLTGDHLAEVQAGVDSVAALLDSVLWTMPLVGSDWQVSDAERDAFEDAARRMDEERGLFTRYYGQFEGRRVENHCPGANVARRLFAQAWALCTGGS